MQLSEQLDAAIERQRLKPGSVLEASLSRIWQHHGTTGFVVITAWRGDQSQRENEAAMKRLKADIRGAGFGFIPVEGVGQEKVDGKIVQATEPSLLIPNKKKSNVALERTTPADELRRLALQWGKKYKQFAVLVHNPATGTEIVQPNGEVVARAAKFSANTAAEFFTRLRKGNRSFTLEGSWWGIKYGDPPGSFTEGYARQIEGQVSIAERSDTVGNWLAELGSYT